MTSFPGYTMVSNNRFQIDYNITITLTLDFRHQVDWLYNQLIIYKVIHGPKLISNLDLKLLTYSADTTLSGKLFHTDTILCEK